MSFSTFQAALDCFMWAERLAPGFYSKNQMMIGKCYLRLGKTAKARSYLENVKDQFIIVSTFIKVIV